MWPLPVRERKGGDGIAVEKFVRANVSRKKESVPVCVCIGMVDVVAEVSGWRVVSFFDKAVKKTEVEGKSMSLTADEPGR